MTRKETILGFQLRQPADQIGNWDAARRAKFLLREDIARPLSVDEAVWPPLNDTVLFRDIFTDPEGSPNGLDLYSIKMELPPIPKKEASLLAITALKPDADHLRARHKIQPPSTSFSELQSRGFNFLGYDAADAWFTSGLMNCGFAHDTKEYLSARYSKMLNENGLFSAIAEAELFQMDCNRRVPDHAPFTIYGLWMYADEP
jgi:hypothetical protein